MKKFDLKTGMVVEYRDGDRRMVVKDFCKEDALLGKCGFNVLSNYNEDLTSKNGDNDTDIVKIFNVGSVSSISEMIDFPGDVIWEIKKENLDIERFAKEFNIELENFCFKKGLNKEDVIKEMVKNTR